MAFGGGYGAHEGKALVYTVEILREKSEEVVQELGQADVKMAVVIEVTADRPGYSENVLAVMPDADQFADRLAHESPASVVEDVITWWHSEEARYQVDFPAQAIIDLGGGGRRVMALAPSGIQLPSPDPITPGVVEYECNGPEPHRFRELADIGGQACPKSLSDGDPCPGVLERV